jgi:hypothetical protein
MEFIIYVPRLLEVLTLLLKHKNELNIELLPIKIINNKIALRIISNKESKYNEIIFIETTNIKNDIEINDITKLKLILISILSINNTNEQDVLSFIKVILDNNTYNKNIYKVIKKIKFDIPK